MREMVSELEEHLKSENTSKEHWFFHANWWSLIIIDTESLLRQQYEEQAGRNRGLEEELESLQQELAKQREQSGSVS